jgi:hypothetical protein
MRAPSLRLWILSGQWNTCDAFVSVVSPSHLLSFCTRGLRLADSDWKTMTVARRSSWKEARSHHPGWTLSPPPRSSVRDITVCASAQANRTVIKSKWEWNGFAECKQAWQPRQFHFGQQSGVCLQQQSPPARLPALPDTRLVFSKYSNTPLSVSHFLNLSTGT